MAASGDQIRAAPGLHRSWRRRLGSDGLLHLYAFDLATGRVRRRLDEHGSWVASTPAYEDGIVYATTSDTRLVEAVDARTGGILWQQQTTGIVSSAPRNEVAQRDSHDFGMAPIVDGERIGFLAGGLQLLACGE